MEGLISFFGPVVTTEAHLAFSGAKTHSNNTAEMTAIIEALSFLGPHGPVARDEQSCNFCDYQLAAGVCLGTIQARTHVQLALACQRSMLCAQHRLRLTMQHVFGHNGNLGNECADAAALGTFGLTSSHNVATRWTHNNFDASVCFDGCNNISDVLERLQHIRTDATTLPQNRRWRCVNHRVHCVSCASHAHFFVSSLILLSAFLFCMGTW